MKNVTLERLKELLYYSPLTGDLIWKVGVCNVKKGSIAGCMSKGYIDVGIDGRIYRAHRLAWFYVHGYFPEHGLDHINRIGTDNRIENLREATQQCNMRNTGNRKDNTSGVKGVSWQARTKLWMGRIVVNGKDKHLGYHKDFAEAVCLRLAAEQCLDWEGCDSSSPAYQYVQKNIILNRGL